MDNKLFSYLTAGTIILILLCSGILTNITYAQVLKPALFAIHNSTNARSQSQRAHEVKITSTKGQQVQADKGLAISGTSGQRDFWLSSIGHCKWD